LRHRQHGEGGVGPSDAVRQLGPRASGDDGASHRRRLSMTVTAPKGFAAAGIACGIKPSGDADLALVATTDAKPVSAAAVFTSNLAPAAPVQVSRCHLEATAGRAAALTPNSGNANAATARQAVEDAERTT